VDVLLRPLLESSFGTTGVMLLASPGEIEYMIYGKEESESRKKHAKEHNQTGCICMEQPHIIIYNPGYTLRPLLTR
jgi:hypothetical protein